MEENLFPSQHGSSSAEDIEEERRLFYVALTRAEKRATLSYALSRFKWGSVVPSQASRFIKEIDPKYLDMPTLPDNDSFGGESSEGVLRGRWNGSTRTAAADPRPAFQRFQRRTATPPAEQAAPAGFRKVEARPASAQGKPLDSAGDLTVGARVAHDRFGVGTVTAFEQTATDTKVTVRFEAAGTKTLLLKFARLRLL